MITTAELRIFDFPLQQFLALPGVFPNGLTYMCGIDKKTVYFEANALTSDIKLVFFLADADREEYIKNRKENS